MYFRVSHRTSIDSIYNPEQIRNPSEFQLLFPPSPAPLSDDCLAAVKNHLWILCFSCYFMFSNVNI